MTCGGGGWFAGNVGGGARGANRVWTMCLCRHDAPGHRGPGRPRGRDAAGRRGRWVLRGREKRHANVNLMSGARTGGRWRTRYRRPL